MMRPFYFLFFLMSFCPFFYPLFGQSYISGMADRYQYTSDCLHWEGGMVYLGRHAAGTDGTGKWLAAVYGENSGWPGGQRYFSAISRIPVQPGNLNFLVDYSGAGDFHEMQTGIGYARNLGPLIQVGIRLNYYRIQIDGYGKAQAFPVEWGTIFQWSSKLRTSLHIYNLAAARPDVKGLSRIPTVIRMGIGYTISSGAGLVVELIKESAMPVSLQPVIYYQASKKLFFRAGLATGNRSAFMSGGYFLGPFRLDLSTAYLGFLGWSTGIGLQLLPKEMK